MYKEAIERTEYYRTVWDRSKECFLMAISSVMYLNQVLVNGDNLSKKNVNSGKLDEFIAKTKLSLCLTSPMTRERDVEGKANLGKDV